MPTVLTTADDISWAAEVHGVPRDMRFVILHGHHEGNPSMIEAWRSPDPLYDDAPDYVWHETEDPTMYGAADVCVDGCRFAYADYRDALRFQQAAEYVHGVPARVVPLG